MRSPIQVLSMPALDAWLQRSEWSYCKQLGISDCYKNLALYLLWFWRAPAATNFFWQTSHQNFRSLRCNKLWLDNDCFEEKFLRHSWQRKLAFFSRRFLFRCFSTKASSWADSNWQLAVAKWAASSSWELKEVLIRRDYIGGPSACRWQPLSLI